MRMFRKFAEKPVAKGIAFVGIGITTTTMAAIIDHQQDVEFQKNNPGKPMRKNFFVVNGMPISTREVEEEAPSNSNRM